MLECLIAFLLAIEPEITPKWESFSDVLAEIHRDAKNTAQTVLVLVENQGTCIQLKQVKINIVYGICIVFEPYLILCE